MSKAEGKKITVKFTEEIINSVDNIVLPDYPEISGYTTQTDYDSSSTINIPETTQSGDLMLLFWAKDDDPIESVADGWERIFTSYDTYHRLSVHYKYYQGEAKQFTLTHDSEETSAIVVAVGKVGIPVISDAYKGTTATPTPPSLASGFEVDAPTLWFAFAGCDYRDVSGFPLNFPDNNISSNRSGVGLGIASLYSTNPSETPSNFILSASEQTSAGTLAITFKSKEDILKDEIKEGWEITGQEYKYVYSPLLDKTYGVDSIEIHPTVLKALLLNMSLFNNFNNVEGNLTVEYDATKGNLSGTGGVVESFIEVFTPTELIQTPNPNVEEYIAVAPIEVVADLLDIEYPKAYGDEIITVAPFEVTATLIDVEDINP